MWVLLKSYQERSGAENACANLSAQSLTVKVQSADNEAQLMVLERDLDRATELLKTLEEGN